MFALETDLDSTAWADCCDLLLRPLSDLDLRLSRLFALTSSLFLRMKVESFGGLGDLDLDFDLDLEESLRFGLGGVFVRFLCCCVMILAAETPRNCFDLAFALGDLDFGLLRAGGELDFFLDLGGEGDFLFGLSSFFL